MIRSPTQDRREMVQRRDLVVEDAQRHMRRMLGNRLLIGMRWCLDCMVEDAVRGARLFVGRRARALVLNQAS